MDLRIALVAAALAAALQGCRATESSVEFTGLCDFNEACSFSSTCDAYLGNKPWVDAEATEFVVFAEFRNGRTSTADAETNRFNTADAFITRYDVEILGVTAHGLDVGPYLVPAGGSKVVPVWLLAGGTPQTTVESGATTSPGLPLVARVTVSGAYRDGTEFRFDVDIPFLACSDCWVACAEACPGVGQIGSCAAAATP